MSNLEWPVLAHYDSNHLRRIALPIGGIGTGTVSLGGRGDLRDWEVMNRPAKGFVPRGQSNGCLPFFALYARTAKQAVTRLLEGPLELDEYEGASGSPVPNHGLPRFRNVSFSAAYPLGQVFLTDPRVPLQVTLQAFNPLVPADVESSSLPAAFMRWVLTNPTDEAIEAAVCASMPNFIGIDGSLTKKDWVNNQSMYGAKGNLNQAHASGAIQGIFMKSEGVPAESEAWGTMALATTAQDGVTHMLSWNRGTAGWGSDLLAFWDDFSADGMLEDVAAKGEDIPMASLAVRVTIPAGETRSIPFLLAWHFPNRNTWTPEGECKDGCCQAGDRLTNHYAVQFPDAWEAAEYAAAHWAQLEEKTLSFVNAFCSSDLNAAVKEAALFNLSTLRSQTCFRSADGRFYAWEGCADHGGCCHGSCTHVWNYEQATAFLFGDLAKIMREVEFGQCTDEGGLMSFRVNLPVERAQKFARAAADGQMGTIMKMYRDWQLSGDEAMLRRLWPQVKAALAFCWVEGGWDADRDGVMEGCQHNTMDVEYYGPNPQMESWYLGALRAGEEMARYLGDDSFAAECGRLYANGRAWTDANLFNGEFYIHEVRPAQSQADIHPGLLLGMGAKDLSHPDYQLGPGCLVDQLVGQYMAHVCGLGYLLEPEHVQTTLRSILKYNYKENFSDHFNCMRSYVLGDESALLMASYPHERPANPFPYFTEVMTGFEYTAAVGMIYEGQVEEGLKCIRSIRERYDGRKRSPFDEAECGHHYARAMASWAAVLALSGFQFSAVEQSMRFAPRSGQHFWSTGSAWGTCAVVKNDAGWRAELAVLHGEIAMRWFGLGSDMVDLTEAVHLGAGRSLVIDIPG
jgi:non-lysosomal glucosylceramidase